MLNKQKKRVQFDKNNFTHIHSAQDWTLMLVLLEILIWVQIILVREKEHWTQSWSHQCVFCDNYQYIYILQATNEDLQPKTGREIQL